MLNQFLQWLPADGVKLVLVLFLSFLVGLEREEHRAEGEIFSFGGVRTFPLIGLIGFTMALLAGGQIVPVSVGFLAVAAFLALSYWHKLSATAQPGATTEMAGLATYLVGALVYAGHFWFATALAVAIALILELKLVLEALTRRIPPAEVLTFTKFLLLSAVILPVLPNRPFTSFQINPFKAWLVVVAVSAVSYGSYVLQKATKGRGGALFAALLGGAYSSTITTLVLAKRASREQRPHLFSGAILLASGVMYLRLAGLVALFNRGLMKTLGPAFVILAGLGAAGGWLWSRRPDAASGEVRREFEPKNPLELRSALLFALLFVAMLVATHVAVTYLGRAGVYGLAAVMGVTDVDPFIMGMTQAAGSLTPLKVASAGIVIAAASNNVVKGIYARSFSDRSTGAQSFALLVGLALAGLVPLLWLLA
jgi:uncharacterized membrane protein (DUF4010 family)